MPNLSAPSVRIGRNFDENQGLRVRNPTEPDHDQTTIVLAPVESGGFLQAATYGVAGLLISPIMGQHNVH